MIRSLSASRAGKSKGLLLLLFVFEDRKLQRPLSSIGSTRRVGSVPVVRVLPALKIGSCCSGLRSSTKLRIVVSLQPNGDMKSPKHHFKAHVIGLLEMQMYALIVDLCNRVLVLL